MSKCPFDAKSDGAAIVQPLVQVRKQRLDPLQAIAASEEAITNVIKESFVGYKLEEDYPKLIDLILAKAKKYGLVEADPQFFTAENLNTIFFNVSNNIDLNPSTPITTEVIENTPQIRTRKGANLDALEQAYGLCHEALSSMQSVTNQNLFDCLFINRGSVDGQPLGVVKTNTDLNNNIQQYQEGLLRKVCTYLKECLVGAQNIENIKDVRAMLDTLTMYKDGKYTGALEQLSSYINMYLQTMKGNSDSIREAFSKSQDTTIRPSVRTKFLHKIEAFNALNLLENFDSYLSDMLGKCVIIDDFNNFTGDNKYFLSDKSANVFTTWRKDDNISPEEEVDMITKLAVTTTPLLYWGKDTPTGSYLSFSDFQHIIAKIKDIPYNEEAYSIIFNTQFQLTHTAFWDSLSKETQSLIDGKSLNTVITRVRANPRLYLACIFDILSKEEFRSIYPKLYSNFSIDERNKLYSISKGLFIGENSIRELTDSRGTNDYYAYLAQTADSICNVEFLQHYKDENGIYSVRKLLDQSLTNLRRQTEEKVNLINSCKLIGNWDNYKEKYQIKISRNPNTQTINEVSFTIPNTNIQAHVYPATGTVRMTLNGSLIDYEVAYSQLQHFIDEQLGLNLEANPILKNHLIEGYNTIGSMSEALAKFAARTILHKTVQMECLQKEDNRSIDEESRNAVLKATYGTPPNWNYNTEELGMIHGQDVDAIYKIATAKANMSGLMTATQVKNAEGKSQSKQSLSRLLGNLLGQFELLERTADSASRNYMLLNIPGLFEGVYTDREFADYSSKAKDTTKMNTGEMTTESFLYDFIGGLVPREKSPVGNGHVLFLPSVNADKTTIGRIKINLNKIVNGKALKDYTGPELESLIAQEFGTFYENMIQNVQSDWQILQTFIRETEPNIAQVPDLANDYLNGFKYFNLWYEANKTKTEARNQNLNIVDWVKLKTLEYNKQHRLQPLELIDQVHYKGKTSLSVNDTISAQLFRFKPTSQLFTNYSNWYFNQYGIAPSFGNTSKYITSQAFWNLKKVEVLRGLIKNNVQINTINSNQIEGQYLKDNYKDWINDSGDLIFARVQNPRTNEWINVTGERDFIKYGLDWFDTLTHNPTIQLNPLIEKYNYYEYLFTQEFMNCTVGSFVAHPDKSGAINVLEQESAQFGAQHKRNVAMTAQMHEFNLNLLNGIPSTYNIAVVDDISDFQTTITGVNNRIKPFDGATFVNPFVVILENNSLCGAKAGISKKQFVHFKNARTGTGGIIKTAGFGLTNDWIRNSPFLENMMQKMTDHVWLNKDGSEAHVNIFKNYRGANITTYEPIYFKGTDGFFYEAQIEAGSKPNTYKRKIRRISEFGNPREKDYHYEEEIGLDGEAHVKEYLVNTNYKLWQLFGGARSLHKQDDRMVLSNTSIDNVVVAMNNCKSEETITPEIVDTQEDLWQPLKMVDVHYVATAGAVKQGGANINSNAKYQKGSEDYDIQRIKVYQAGIQLDKEHHADESELSLMTQVIAACAAKGYTFDAAVKLYDALSAGIQNNTSDHLATVNELFETNSPDQLREVVYKSIIKLLETSNSQNFATDLAKELMQKARNGEDIKFSEALIPLSDNNIYAKVLSTINSYLTKTGIKQKIPGILSVLTPSFGVNKLHAGRKYESFNNPEVELEELQKQQKPVFDINDAGTSISDIELGREYFITRTQDVDTEIEDMEGNISIAPVPTTTTESEPIMTIDQYDKLKQDIKDGIVTRVTENVIKGRDLAGYNVRYKGVLDGESYRFQLYDLDSYRTLFKLDQLQKDLKKAKTDEVRLQLLQRLKDLYTAYYDTAYPEEIPIAQVSTQFERDVRRDLQHNINALTEEVPDITKQYLQLSQTFENSPEWYKHYAQWVNIQLNLGFGSQILYNGQLTPVNEDNFMEISQYVNNLIKRTSQVKIDGKYYDIDRTSIVKQPYEVIMPKIFATVYGLREFDSLDAIAKDKQWFIKQFQRNCRPAIRPNQYSIGFMRGSGQHIYVLDRKSLPKMQGLHKVASIKTDIQDDVTVRLDKFDDPMYPISTDAEIYADSRGHEVIVTDDLKFYMDNLDYDAINLSKGLTDHRSLLVSLPKILQSSTNKMARSLGRHIGNNHGIVDVILSQAERFNEIKPGTSLYKQLIAKHTSFLRSLDVVAARIPAQSMQSYMPMRVVAFDNPNINTAYVSTYQILLQGSDY